MGARRLRRRSSRAPIAAFLAVGAVVVAGGAYVVTASQALAGAEGTWQRLGEKKNKVAKAASGPKLVELEEAATKNPFRSVFPDAPVKRSTLAPQIPQPGRFAPVAAARAPVTPAPSAPVRASEPQVFVKLEGMLPGDDPIAVLRVGQESHIVRAGEPVADGVVVTAITDTEVRVMNRGKELVLKRPNVPPREGS